VVVYHTPYHTISYHTIPIPPYNLKASCLLKPSRRGRYGLVVPYAVDFVLPFPQLLHYYSNGDLPVLREPEKEAPPVLKLSVLSRYSYRVLALDTIGSIT
jgi:hypothetical protein